MTIAEPRAMWPPMCRRRCSPAKHCEAIRGSDIETRDPVTCCPTQFQQFIEDVDSRVHVIGDRAFSSKITSAADDFRYSSETRIDDTTLPASVAETGRRLRSSVGEALRSQGSTVPRCRSSSHGDSIFLALFHQLQAGTNVVGSLSWRTECGN